MSQWTTEHWATSHFAAGHAVTDIWPQHYRCLTAVRAGIRALALSGLADTSVLVKKLPLERVFKDNANKNYPGVLITPGRQTANPLAGTNVQDDINYAVQVALIDSDNQEATLLRNLDRNLLWLEKFRRAFHNRRLSTVNTVYTCAARAVDCVLPAAWLNNLWVSILLLEFSSRETRG